MKISNIKINGVQNPIGYLMENVRCSWKVTDTVAKKQDYAVLEISDTEDFKKIIYKKEGHDLSQAGELLDFTLKPYTRYYLKVTVTTELNETASGTSYFETCKMDIPWQGKWITTKENDKFHPLFFKSFSVENEVSQARLYISGLGMFEALLNGEKIGEEVLTPYYSNYHNEIQYFTYDITEKIKRQNEILVSLGNGWYKGRFGLQGKAENFGNKFQIIAEIHLRFKDGTESIISTNESWKYIGSDVEQSDIYDGETLNRLLWYGKENLIKDAVITDAEGTLMGRYSIPVKEMEEVSVKKIIKTPANETVLDFGQNFAGYPVFISHLPKGTKIVLDFGEILQNGNFYNDNYRSAKSQFVYVSDGREELVKPRFTFFGFRYMRVTGWVGNIKSGDFKGKAIYSDMKVTGNIKTGNAGVNKLFSNAMWGQKSNSIDFPTDCPQRDERLGWTGDAQVFSGTASYNMDTAAFYNKFIHDLRNEQKRFDGILPGVIPVFDDKSAIFSSVWGDIATFLPMVIYEHFGDKEGLRLYYPMMKDWVDKITKEDIARGQRYLFDFGNQLGDWLALDGRTEQSMKGGTDDYFISSCYYAASVQKVADAAKILGLHDEEAYYRDLYRKIYDAILKEYFSETGRICIDTQTGYIVALYFGIYKDKRRIVEGLKNRLYKDCYKLKGGFVGAPIMCRVMAENGMEEEAFYFLLQEDFPGWMHCINLGATTLWERWNSVLDNGMLSGTMMNSLNHYAFGAIVEYLYRDVAGLKAIEPGFKKVQIKPLLNQKLRFMKMSYDCPYGIYRCEWNICKNGSVKIHVEIPFGCSAKIRLPYFNGNVIEANAGNYTYKYMPTVNVRHLYTRKTLFKEMMKDPKALEIIKRVSPYLHNFLSSGDEEFLNESLDTLQDKFFMGFSNEEIDKLTKELTSLSN